MQRQCASSTLVQNLLIVEIVTNVKRALRFDQAYSAVGIEIIRFPLEAIVNDYIKMLSESKQGAVVCTWLVVVVGDTSI